MGNVDQADQLRLQYCIHYWLRNQKWWFAIFLWILECSHTHSYVLYRKFHDLHGRKLPKTNYEFIESIVLAWLKPSQYWSKRKTIRSGFESATDESTVAASIICRRVSSTLKRSATINNNALNPYTGQLCCRLDRGLNHLPVQIKKAEANCQLHNWAFKSKYRKQLLMCPTCNAIICLDCYKMFHEVSDLSILKN